MCWRSSRPSSSSSLLCDHRIVRAEDVKQFDLTIKARRQTDELRPADREHAAPLRARSYELRASADEELCYEVKVPFDVERGPRDQRHPARSIPRATRRSSGGKEEQGEVDHREAHHPARRRPDPAAAGGQARQEVDRHRHLPLRSVELEKALAAAVARGVAVRALIAHTNRGGEKNLRKLEMRLLGRGRHRGAHRRRPGALPRQDDDRRRHAVRPRLQLHAARHRAQPQLRYRDARQAPGQGGRARCSRPTAPGSRTRPATTASSSAPRARASC